MAEINSLEMVDSETERILTSSDVLDVESPSSPDTNINFSTLSEAHLSKRFRDEVRQYHAHLKLWQRPSLLVACAIVVLYCFSEMIFVTPMISLTLNKVCEGLKKDTGSDTCDKNQVQTTLSNITSVKMMISSFIGLIAAGKIGPLSDRFGRSKIFVYMGLVNLVSNAVCAFAVSSYVDTHIYLIIFTGCISSLGGGTFALAANINSYITDIIEPEDRTASMSTVTSIMHAVVGLSPLISSFLIKLNNGNDMVSVYCSLISISLFTLLCMFMIKESRHPDAMEMSRNTHRKRLESMVSTHSIRLSGSHTFTSRSYQYIRYRIEQILEIFSPLKELWLPPTISGSLVPRYNVLLLISLDSLVVFSTMALMPALILFTTYEYSWKSVEIGYFISFSGLCNAVVLWTVSWLLSRWLSSKYAKVNHSVDKVDITTLQISCVSLILGTGVLLAYASTSKGIICHVIIKSVSAIMGPTLQSTIVKYYGTNTGQVFGGVALLHSIGMLFSPAIMLKIYGSTVSKKPETFLFLPFLVCIVAFGLTFFLRVIYIHDPIMKEVDDEDSELDSSTTDLR